MQQHYDSAYRRLDAHVEAASLRPHPDAGARPYHARPKTRNGNVLSAVLCLIKELDYTSLEVAEMAIRCRMDELDD
ncbi:uncharacterized protein LOC108682931 isoform X2 [Hyalella azteca]|uniref:Uncharacterized protein LOC108682931 isoform X2 n=1 Tax=Hyalella azteca TaxID=294128 RepID=A0A979FIH5_HYAAZ|nr:uncharacterized protein LOC108682931 isoform X2 [Hyalella azteca]